MNDPGRRAEALKTMLREAKSLATRYYALTQKPLGVTGEIAELEAAEKLGLTLAEARTPSYDAVAQRDGELHRYQIKGRAVDPRNRYKGRMPSIKCGGAFESVLLVLLDQATYDALEIWQARREDVQM